MTPIAVVGIGTEVGKSVVSALLARLLSADYWKPVSCGQDRDRALVARWSGRPCHPEAYWFKAPLSPNLAAGLEGIEPQLEAAQLPEGPLIVEGCGGVLTPFSDRYTMADLFLQWEMEWLIVSRHFLGSLNQTLMTVEAVRSRGIEPAGLIFVGDESPASEHFLSEKTGLPCAGVLRLKPPITKQKIIEECERWRKQTFWSERLNWLAETRPTAGTLTPSI